MQQQKVTTPRIHSSILPNDFRTPTGDTFTTPRCTIAVQIEERQRARHTYTPNNTHTITTRSSFLHHPSPLWFSGTVLKLHHSQQTNQTLCLPPKKTKKQKKTRAHAAVAKHPTYHTVLCMQHLGDYAEERSALRAGTFKPHRRRVTNKV